MTEDWPRVTCTECLYWEPFDNTFGWCKRRSPEIAPSPYAMIPYLTVWPKTKRKDWCGEGVAR
jgi:hypothetical protein